MLMRVARLLFRCFVCDCPWLLLLRHPLFAWPAIRFVNYLCLYAHARAFVMYPAHTMFNAWKPCARPQPNMAQPVILTRSLPIAPHPHCLNPLQWSPFQPLSN